MTLLQFPTPDRTPPVSGTEAAIADLMEVDRVLDQWAPRDSGDEHVGQRSADRVRDVLQQVRDEAYRAGAAVATDLTLKETR